MSWTESSASRCDLCDASACDARFLDIFIFIYFSLHFILRISDFLHLRERRLFLRVIVPRYFDKIPA